MNMHISQALKFFLPVGLTVGTLVGVAFPAKALQFNFTYQTGNSTSGTTGVTLQQMIGVEMAGLLWGSYLGDNATVNLHIAMSNNLGTNTIGGALPGMKYQHQYESFRNAMIADANKTLSTTDNNAANTLDSHRDNAGVMYYKHWMDEFTWNTYNVTMTQANAKALGLIDAQSSQLDGAILMSNLNNLSGITRQWSYDYDRNGFFTQNGSQVSTTSTSLDFLSVMIHEIGHQLGFINGADTAVQAATLVTGGTEANQENINRAKRTTPLDMFRYTTNSTATGRTDVSVGQDVYFSLNDGATRTADFAQGDQLFGAAADGFQTSHWQRQTPTSTNADPFLGIMDPALRAKAIASRQITNLDLQAFDVIGWDQTKSVGLSDFSSYALANIEAQAKQRIASRLGVSVGTLTDALVAGNSGLTRDRTSDINTMLTNSHIYNWKTMTWSQSGLQQVFGQQAYNSVIDPDETAAVPEPMTLAGLLTLGLTGIWQKRQKRMN